ncbi:6-phosphogluconolactonase, eukaryotic type [Rhodovulum sp. P5]|uniref:6-phosphogluconolactonase n=1 Tax=Rhodovulum sp. P5 TaxID=1564506 RepID=UPI0009C2EF3F|nr:6-phosphogluconolactonase [Rhodovulum sp. P5]ARE40348.1 6-phosphogluconolactonase, eukaryotic type [Rhodovulum sp. P5]
MNLIEYPDLEMLIMDLANKLAGEIKNALFHEDRITIALPGGTTPGPLYDDLCGASLDWDRVRVIPTDERLVPADHPRSNEALLKARLLTGKASDARFISLRPGADGMAGLTERVKRTLPLSVAVLGMGEDLHTASLFPGAPELEAALASDAPPVMQITPPEEPEARITLTAPVLKGALNTHVLITGWAKRAAVERAREMEDSRLAPICTVLKDATVHWTE